MKFLPAFVRRAVLLRRARELLAAGDGRAALTLLADPVFDGVPSARELAAEAENRLAQADHGTRASITELLARLREERARRGGQAPASVAENGAASAPSAVPESSGAGAVIAFRLAVDDAGEYLVVVGAEITIGHESSTRANLRFLAHVEREHARLVFTDDFHSGPTWRVVPIGTARVHSGGRDVGRLGAVILDGDRVVLGKNLVFCFRAEGLTSSSAVLEFEQGIECHGAGRLLLLAPGSQGRVQISASSKRPIRVAGLTHAVTLEITPTHSAIPDAVPEARLSIGCESGIARGVRPAADAPTSLSLIVPPRASERFTFAARAKGEAPFEIVVAPLEELPG